MKKISLILAAVFIISGCSIFPKKPEPQIVTITERWCPAQQKIARPNYVELEKPVFYVVTPDDERLKEAGRLIAISADGYEALGELVESFIVYAGQCSAGYEYYEKMVDRINNQGE